MGRYLLKKMHRVPIIAVFNFSIFLCVVQLSFAQNKSIGVNTSTPDESAILEILSNSKGLLIPRLSLEAVNNASPVDNPANTLLVYNTNPNIIGGLGEGYYYNDNKGNPMIVNWVKIPADNFLSGWKTIGNAGLNINNFVGTLNDADMVFKVNNQEAIRVTAGGALLATGNANDGVSPIPANAELGMAWIPARNAFRVIGGEFFNEDNPNLSLFGQNSFCFGFPSKVSGANAVGIGAANHVLGDNSMNIGAGNSTVSGTGSVKIGGGVNDVKSDFTFKAGPNSIATGNNSTALSYANASGKFSTAIGYVITARGTASTAFGGGGVVQASGRLDASARASWVVGMWNDSLDFDFDAINNDDRVFEIGNGWSSINRGDALFVERDGDLVIQGIMTAKNGMVGPSDIRLKENIEPLTNALDKIAKIQPIYFNFKDTKTYSSDHQLGFIAQEVKAQFPEFVKTARNGYLSVNYGGMNAVVIEAIKEQQDMLTKNENLQESFDTLLDSQRSSIQENKLMLHKLIKENKELEKRTKQLEKFTTAKK